GGGALALAPDIGPFCYAFILDRVRASAYTADLAQVRTTASASIELDTWESAKRAIDAASAAHGRMPRYRPPSAYYAYLLFPTDRRVGRNSADDQRANEALADVVKHGVRSDVVTLAQAAKDAVDRNFARARQAALGPAQADVDFAVLAGE